MFVDVLHRSEDNKIYVLTIRLQMNRGEKKDDVDVGSLPFYSISRW